LNETVNTWGEAVLVSVTEALSNFLGFLPALVGAVLVVVLGWIVSGFLGRIVESALKRIGFEHAANQTGINDFVARAGQGWSASRIAGELVKWFIRLIAIQAAAQILGMDQIGQIINAILLWIPNLMVALGIVVIGVLIGRVVGGSVRASTSEMGLGSPALLGGVAQYAVVAFAVVAAMGQLGIGETVVNTLFIGIVGAVALAFAIAFGLGGREVAADITRGWYESGRGAGQKIATYAERRRVDRERLAVAGEPVVRGTTIRPVGEGS
jgi:hypothetical protein